ncbi:hypothetical protein AO385_1544 [Moraxella catarrhalis]|uniref:Uncharacterized protein n=1 Tax=Moraxella catarrhalis TaxID=480 RepID=A0A198UNB6_MORCA|nr:hypothetical protein AO383_1797 [Moraxella catarrhalis]OAU97993.1 hypothetical protein AO384_0240 [Moraxella catarrhalis]OAU98918.1 hypothetical protein AO385_1544 [Moraxella catarrhalis]
MLLLMCCLNLLSWFVWAFDFYFIAFIIKSARSHLVPYCPK